MDVRTQLATDETLNQIAHCMVSGKKKQRTYVATEVGKLGCVVTDFHLKTEKARALKDLELRGILFAIDF